MTQDSYLYNAAFIDDLYELYLVNPAQVPNEWRDYFKQLQQEQPFSIGRSLKIYRNIKHATIR